MHEKSFLMTRNELKNLEMEIPEIMAMSMFLIKYSDEDGKMIDIMSDDEFLLEQEKDPGYKDLCDLLLEFPFVKRMPPVVYRDKVTGLSRKQQLSIELDRAKMWRNMYKTIE